MRTPDPQKTAKPSAVDGADFTGGPSLLAVLERIACALEHQNEMAQKIDDSLTYTGNMVEVIAGRLGG